MTAKLTDRDAATIRRQFKTKTMAELAEAYDVSVSTVSKVLRNETHYDSTYAVPDRIQLQDYVEELLDLKRNHQLTNAAAGAELAKRVGRERPWSETSVRNAIEQELTSRAEAWARQREHEEQQCETD